MAVFFDSLLKSAANLLGGSTIEPADSLALNKELPESLVNIRIFLGDENALSGTEARIRETGLDSKTKEQLDLVWQKIISTQDNAKDFLRNCFEKYIQNQAAIIQKERLLQLLDSMGVDEVTSNDIYLKIVSNSIDQKEDAAVKIEQYIQAAVKTKVLISFLGENLKKLNLPDFHTCFSPIIDGLKEITGLIAALESPVNQEDWQPPVNTALPYYKQDPATSPQKTTAPQIELIKNKLREELNPSDRYLRINLSAEGKVQKLSEELVHLANEIHHVRSKIRNSKFVDQAVLMHLNSMEEESRIKEKQLEFYQSQLSTAFH